MSGRRFKPSTPKPHHMAEPLAAPCVKCGYEWGRPIIDTSDVDADEWPLTFGCARCKHVPSTPTSSDREET